MHLNDADARNLYVGNLECAFSDDSVESGKAYTRILRSCCICNVKGASFAALSPANNHVYDAGIDAFMRMRSLLLSRCPGIQFFGTVETPYADLVVNDLRVAIFGCLELCRNKGEQSFRQEDVLPLIKQTRDDFDLVYVFLHCGKEGEDTRRPSPAQCKLVRKWIDRGADGVFGCHSHMFQGREIYKAKPIYYSLGNFEFDHPESQLYSGTDRGLVVEVDGNGQIREYVKPQNECIRSMREEERTLLSEISSPLSEWTIWNWAKSIGSFNIKKNTASWRIRLRKNFIKTLPKFLVWQLLPKTLLFRAAALFN